MKLICKYSINEDYEGSGSLKTYGVGNQGYVYLTKIVNHCLKSYSNVGIFRQSPQFCKPLACLLLMKIH